MRRVFGMYGTMFWARQLYRLYWVGQSDGEGSNIDVLHWHSFSQKCVRFLALLNLLRHGSRATTFCRRTDTITMSKSADLFTYLYAVDDVTPTEGCRSHFRNDIPCTFIIFSGRTIIRLYIEIMFGHPAIRPTLFQHKTVWSICGRPQSLSSV